MNTNFDDFGDQILSTHEVLLVESLTRRLLCVQTPKSYDQISLF